MPKNKGELRALPESREGAEARPRARERPSQLRSRTCPAMPRAGKGGKNRRRGKNEGDDKRELIFKEDGQGAPSARRAAMRPRLQARSRPARPRPGPAGRRSRLRRRAAEYAQVLRMLGNGRLEAFCMDGVKRLCHIRGKMRKKVWVNTGDVVLVGLREYQDEKADVILKCVMGGRAATGGRGGRLAADEGRARTGTAASWGDRRVLTPTLRFPQVHGRRGPVPQGLRRAARQQ